MSRLKKTANLDASLRFRRRQQYVTLADGRQRRILNRSASGLSATAAMRVRSERIRLLLGPPAAPQPREVPRRQKAIPSRVR